QLLGRQSGSLDFGVRGLVRCLALGAYNSHQTLGHDGDNRGGNQERLDTNIDQARNSARRIVRMQCTEYQVSRQRCLHSDLSSLTVTNSPHQDDIGGLTQHGTNDTREVQADLMFHLDLINSRQVVFDGILRGDDLPIRPIQLVQGRVQGRRLSRAGRSGYQEDAVGPLDDVLEAPVIVFREAQILNAHLYTTAVQNAHDAGLTHIGRQEADAQVIVFAGDAHFDAPVLGTALLGNVDRTHDLEA